MPFWPLCCESEAILSKGFVPVTRAGVFIWENSHPSYRDLGGNIVGRKNRDLGNLACPVFHVNTSKFLQRKEWLGEISETEPALLTRLIWRGPEKWICTLSRERVGEVQEKSNTTLRRSRRTRKRIHLNEFKVSSSVPSSTCLFQKIFRFFCIVFIYIQSVLIIIKAKVIILI